MQVAHVCNNDAMYQEIKVGQIYKHYKGALYKVIAIAIDTESGTIDDPLQVPDSAKRVIYYAIGKEDIIWDRPYTMFAGMVDIGGVIQKRFTLSTCGKRLNNNIV